MKLWWFKNGYITRSEIYRFVLHMACGGMIKELKSSVIYIYILKFIIF